MIVSCQSLPHKPAPRALKYTPVGLLFLLGPYGNDALLAGAGHGYVKKASFCFHLIVINGMLGRQNPLITAGQNDIIPLQSLGHVDSSERYPAILLPDLVRNLVQRQPVEVVSDGVLALILVDKGHGGAEIEIMAAQALCDSVGNVPQAISALADIINEARHARPRLKMRPAHCRGPDADIGKLLLCYAL